MGTTTQSSGIPTATEQAFGVRPDIDKITQNQVNDEVQSILKSEPGQAPDISDAHTKLAADAQARTLLTQRGRSSTFLGSSSLDDSMPQASKSLLGS